MYLQTITIRNWKVYKKAHFEFPKPDAGKNIVLIGAHNGHGKTSFFESVILGLFGKNGMHLIDRAQTYTKFMEDALHRGVVRGARNTCSVELVFVDSDDEKIELQRIWHFRPDGKIFANDEEIKIYKGPNRKAIGPEDGLRGTDRENWFHNYIVKTFLPDSLVHFFLFDGEQASTLAERGMTEQVRKGIEGLLGLPILDLLASDLRDHARSQKRQTRHVDDTTADKIESDLKSLTTTRDETANNLEKTRACIQNLEQERDLLFREIGEQDQHTQFDAQSQTEKFSKYAQARDAAKDELQKMLEGGISLALVGGRLRELLSGRLASENIRTEWDAGQQHGKANLERFISSLIEKVGKAVPMLNQSHLNALIDCVRTAWKDLWHPLPPNCATGYRHVYLGSADRTNVIEKLTTLGDISAHEVTSTLDTIAENDDNARTVQEAISRAASVRPEVTQKAERIKALNSEIDEKNQKVGGLNRDNTALEAQIGTKNQDLARHASMRNQAEPANRRYARALKVANLIDQISRKTMPLQIRAIAEAMTLAFKQMAHKKLVSEIEVSDNCDVTLYNSERESIENHSLSAGEKQVFTQALIAAVVSVSGHSFPMIIDTPLGRLDEQHRKKVLRHLAQRNHQVVLLSTNTEVVGEYLSAIEPHVQKKYQIIYAQNGGVGESRPTEGYFQPYEDTAS